MAEDFFKDVPEDIVEKLKQKYFIYTIQTLDNPILSFEDYSKKVYRLGTLNKELESKTEELAKIKNEMEEIKFSLASEDVDFFINNFESVFSIVLYEGSLTSEEKLAKLKAYYFNYVRDIKKEHDFLNYLNKAINEKLYSEVEAESILIDLVTFIKINYVPLEHESITTEEFNIAKTSIVYDRLIKIVLNQSNGTNENNFSLLKGIFDFNYNKEILLGTISSIKLQDFKEDVPKYLIDFENYVKDNV